VGIAQYRGVLATNKWIGGGLPNATAWDQANNWGLGSAPSSTDDVVIDSGPNQPTISNIGNNTTINSLTVNSGATLTLNFQPSGLAALVVTGAVVNSGSLVHTQLSLVSAISAVKRRDWDGEFREVLDMSPKAVRLGRLNQGAAVLDSHAWDKGLSAMLGGIVPGSARINNGGLTARIKFSRGSELAQRVVRDLEDGIQIPLSVGYKLHATRDDRSTVPLTRIATDWEPFEVSLVPISAEEVGTGFRTAA
jgi:hypothetical protein